MAASSALAQHMLARIVADIDTLAASGTLPSATAASIQAQLAPYLGVSATPAYPSSPAPAPAVQPPVAVEQQRFRAIWAYAAAASDELSFAADDVLLVPAAGAQKGDEWWLGALERAPHVQGLFPSTYVEPLRPSVPRKPSNSTRTLPPAYVPPPISPVTPPVAEPKSPERKLGPPKWRPGVAQFSSNGAEKPPPPPSSAAAAGPSAPDGKPMTPEEAAAAAKKDKLDKFGKKMGMSVAHGFAGGVGFGLARNIF